MNWRAVASITLLAAASPAGSRTQQTKPQESMGVRFPGKSWELKINSPDFSVESEARQPDGREYLLVSDWKTGIVLSVTLVRDPRQEDSFERFMSNETFGKIASSLMAP